ncbi:MAG TPA: HlyD family type I secretion periplasmic adaptor subunit [Gammaproteobacteria bacterium]|jgi:adhesin transport system membrane fusion protein
MSATPRKPDWQDAEFMAEVDAAGPQFVRPSSHLILWATVAFLVIALSWAALATIDEVTRGVGRVMPSGDVQKVQNLEGGIVSQILVAEGDTVARGQPLLRIDDTQFAASLKEANVRIQSLRARIARLQAEVDGAPFTPSGELLERPEIAANELALYQSRREEFETGLSVLEQERRQSQEQISELTAENRMLTRSLELARQELDMKQPLAEKGLLPRVEVLGVEREVTTIDGQLQANEHAIPRARGALAGVERRIEERRASFRTQALADLNEGRLELARLEESRRALEDRVRRTEVGAPVAGIVKQLNVNTIGGVIQPGMDLAEIVPADETLVVEAEVPPSDIAFLRPGQKAIVKLTAYDFAIYGGLDATLEQISADTITNDEGVRVYQIRVRTNHTHLGTDAEPLPIIPGMAAEVDILTGEKTILDYLLKPLRRARDRALRER